MRRLLGGRSFSIGRWFGFQVSIHYSWFVIFALVLWSFSFLEFPRQLPGYGTMVYVTMGVAGTLLFFLSVLLHELSHSAMARRRGIEVAGITLFIFGGVAQTRMEAEEPADEFLLTVVGPLCSLALAGLFFGLETGASWGSLPAPTVEVASYLGWLNLILAVFNLVPGFPLDGGRLFRSSVWYVTGDLEKATRWATRGGQAFGYLLMAYGGWLVFFQGALVGGLWSGFIGWFLSTVAEGSWRQFQLRKTLSAVRVSRVMVPRPESVPANLSLREAVEEYFLRMPGGAFPVVDGERLVGLLSVDDVAGIPQGEWDTTLAGAAARSVEEIPTVEPDETLDEALIRLQSDEGDLVLVTAGGVFRGVVTMEEVRQWLQRIRKLGLDEGPGDPGAASAPGPRAGATGGAVRDEHGREVAGFRSDAGGGTPGEEGHRTGGEEGRWRGDDDRGRQEETPRDDDGRWADHGRG